MVVICRLTHTVVFKFAGSCGHCGSDSYPYFSELARMNKDDTLEKERQITEAKLTAARAQENAEKARLESLKLVDQLTPSQLDDNQSAQLSAACQSLANIRIEISADTPDPASWAFADAIAASLLRSGVIVERRPMKGVTWQGLGSGITVGGSDVDVVRKLHRAFATLGFDVSIGNASRRNAYIALGTRPFTISAR
ncbi:MAG: hypothetical protein SFV18_11290 [Bryobacteraceae bacterium]|nr:hypothetical protein [Bryobacteraceae bacterium]